MKYIKTSDHDISTAIISALVIHKMWLIGVSATDPDDPSTYVLETAIKYHVSGELVDALGSNPVFSEYGLSPSKGGNYPYRLHDHISMPITYGAAITELARSITKTYDVLLPGEGYFDTGIIFGKLGTDHEDEVVARHGL